MCFDEQDASYFDNCLNLQFEQPLKGYVVKSSHLKNTTAVL